MANAIAILYPIILIGYCQVKKHLIFRQNKSGIENMITKLSISTAIGLSLLALTAFAQPNLSLHKLKPIDANAPILAQTTNDDATSFILKPELPIFFMLMTTLITSLR